MHRFILKNKGSCFDQSIDKEKCISEAEEIAKSLIGCVFVTKKGSFIFSMVELYYGGIGDTAHDWYKINKSLYSKLKEHVQVMLKGGLRIYLNHKKQSHYLRMDLVIGSVGVPVSVLVRDAIDVRKRQYISKNKNGNPNIVLNTMGITIESHGQEVKVIQNERDVKIEEHGYWLIDKKCRYEITPQVRINLGKNVAIQDRQRLWNFSIKDGRGSTSLFGDEGVQ